MALLISEGFEHIRGTLDYERRFIESSPSGVPASITQISGRFPGSKCLRAVNGEVYTLRTHDLTPGSITAMLGFHVRSKGNSSDPSGIIIGLLNAANAQQIVVETTNTGGLQQIILRRGGAQLYVSPDLPIDVFYHVELRVKISPTVGEWDLRINEMTVSSGTGDTANGGTAGFARLFAGFSSDTSVNSYIDLDDLILMDDAGVGPFNRMLGATGIESLAPVRLLLHSLPNWTANTGTNRQAVDDALSGVADDDATYIDNSVVGLCLDAYGIEEVTSLHSSLLGVRTSFDARETAVTNPAYAGHLTPASVLVGYGTVSVLFSALYSRYLLDYPGTTPETFFSLLFCVYEDTIAVGGGPILLP